MPMATLQSGDNVSVYYGKGALESAYQAAADSGDVITLSAGVFTSPIQIQKSISIIGNGFVNEQENGKYPTIIDGRMEFSPRDVTDDDGETMTEAIGYDGTRLEGLNFANNYISLSGSRKVHNFSIVKCNVQSIILQTNTENTTIRQSVVSSNLNYRQKNQLNLYLVGSYINQLEQDFTDGMVNIDHCIIQEPLQAGTITNSILRYAGSGVTAYNCIFMENIPTNIMGEGNWVNCKYAGIFAREGMTGLGWSDEENAFALKYPAEYVGTDGTEVGLYGGPYPYNPTPTTPQIKESNIDTTVVEDGKLKVSVTVEAQSEN